MSYGVLATIKSRLHIDTSITSQDTEIGNMITDADNFINDTLTAVNPALTLPLSPVPAEIVSLSNKLATEWYLHYNSVLHPMDGIKVVNKEIESYIQHNYGKRTETLTFNTFSKTKSGITGTEQ